MRKIPLLAFLLLTITANSQVGIGTNMPDISAALEIKSAAKGLLVPRLSAAQISMINSPATALLVYQTDGDAGYYYNSGNNILPVWTKLTTGFAASNYIANSTSQQSSSNFNISGNGVIGGKLTTGAVTYPNTDGTNGYVLTTNGSGVASFAAIPASTSYIANGTSQQSSSNFNISGNGIIGGKLTTGAVTYPNTDGTNGYVLTTNGSGVASFAAIPASTSYISNGTSLQSSSNFNISGNGVIGGDATINGLTVGLGLGARTGNTVIGNSSLHANTSGNYNTTVGINTLYYNTTGGHNALGSNTLFNNTSGYNNTAVGGSALNSNTTGYNNTALGLSALGSGSTGYNNTAIGYLADLGATDLYNATAIGNSAIVSASNTIQLGNNQVTSVKTSGILTTGAVSYPNTDGTSGQVLTTNGSGTPSWQNYYVSGSIVPGSGNYGYLNPSIAGTFVNSSSNIMYYIKVGNLVLFNGIIGAFSQSAGTKTSLNFALPIASTFTSTTDAVGTVSSCNTSFAGVSGSVIANTTNNTLVIQFITTSATSSSIFVSFSGSYIVH